jgi:hypothetical protein
MTDSPKIKISRCRSCDESIVWMRTDAGKNVPVNADSVDEADLDFNEVRQPMFDETKDHVSHFKTCPHAKQWSRR